VLDQGEIVVVRLFATAGPSDRLAEAVESLRVHPLVDVVGIAPTGRETSDAIRNENVDALVVSDHLSDVARLIRVSTGIPLSDPPAMVVAAEQISKPLMARSLASGFDGVVALHEGSDATATRLSQIVEGQHRLIDDPSLGTISLAPGQLARALTVQDDTDRQILDLVGTGLDDREIAALAELTIQEVRNRVEALLFANDLRSRTHLAILRASHVVIPDFA
jgi:DNA-binding NarL/FixJ family response regulator